MKGGNRLETESKTGGDTCTKNGIFSDISFEVIILFIFGIFMLLFGALLFKIHTGEIAYSPDSTYGLFLVIISFQIITLGKTPFGDLPRLWIVLILGMCTAAAGMTACFIPGLLTDFVRILAGAVLFAGGIALLSELLLSKEKAQKWISVPGILRELTIAAALVYIISIVTGILTLIPGITSDMQTGVILLIYGICFFYLAWCIHRVNKEYPAKAQGEAKTESAKEKADTKEKKALKYASGKKSIIFDDASFPLSVSIVMSVGFLLLLLGILLFPVNLGIIPFSPDGQLGLLMVIMAIQMMALGETPLGQYSRSWILMAIGVLFAAIGIFSCVVPGILTGTLQELIGLLNIAGGLILLAGRFIPVIISRSKSPAEKTPTLPVLKNLAIIQTSLNIISIGFGASMFLPGIVPGAVIAGILILNGIMLFALASIVLKIDRMISSGFSETAKAGS